MRTLVSRGQRPCISTSGDCWRPSSETHGQDRKPLVEAIQSLQPDTDQTSPLPTKWIWPWPPMWIMLKKMWIPHSVLHGSWQHPGHWWTVCNSSTLDPSCHWRVQPHSGTQGYCDGHEACARIGRKQAVGPGATWCGNEQNCSKGPFAVPTALWSPVLYPSVPCLGAVGPQNQACLQWWTELCPSKAICWNSSPLSTSEWTLFGKNL